MVLGADAGLFSCGRVGEEWSEEDTEVEWATQDVQVHTIADPAMGSDLMDQKLNSRAMELTLHHWIPHSHLLLP